MVEVVHEPSVVLSNLLDLLPRLLPYCEDSVQFRLVLVQHLDPRIAVGILVEIGEVGNRGG